MSESLESRVIRRFRERLERGDLTEDVKITYRVGGGMPTQRVMEEFRLSGQGRAHTKRLDVLRSIPEEQTTANLDQAETRDLLRQVNNTLDQLIPRPKAAFLPDSVVGSITIEVDGEHTTFYFNPDIVEQQEGQTHAESTAVPLKVVTQRIHTISCNLFEHKKESGHE